MFLRRKSNEPEEDPAEQQESQDSNPPKAANPAAKTALLKAYFVQEGHSESEIENLVGEQVQPSEAEPIGETQPSGVEPLFRDDPAPQTVQEPPLVEQDPPPPPPAPTPAPASVEDPSNERIKELDNRITDLRHVLSGMAQRILDLQGHVEASNNAGQADQTAVSELREALQELKEKSEQSQADLQKTIEKGLASNPGQRLFSLEDGVGGLRKKLEEFSAKAELKNVTVTKMRTDVSELQEKSEHTLADLEMRISKHLRDSIVELSSQVEKRVSEALEQCAPLPGNQKTTKALPHHRSRKSSPGCAR